MHDRQRLLRVRAPRGALRHWAQELPGLLGAVGAGLELHQSQSSLRWRRSSSCSHWAATGKGRIQESRQPALPSQPLAQGAAKATKWALGALADAGSQRQRCSCVARVLLGEIPTGGVFLFGWVGFTTRHDQNGYLQNRRTNIIGSVAGNLNCGSVVYSSLCSTEKPCGLLALCPLPFWRGTSIT